MDAKFLDIMHDWATHSDFVVLSPDQVKRSEDKIGPFIHEITSEIIYIRELLDEDVQKARIKHRGKYHPRSFLGRYPIGKCLEIANKVHKLIISESRDPNYPGLQAIRRYNKTQDAIFKRIWGIQNEQNFQNAIQVGGYCIDSALDTLDSPFPKVQVKLNNQCGVRNITSFRDFAHIAERYWHEDLYPNIYFPHLAPLYPSIAIRKNGAVKFQGGTDTVLGKNIVSNTGDLTNFADAHEFLFDSPFSEKKLPGKYIEKLGQVSYQMTTPQQRGDIKRLFEFEEDGCSIMTEAAIHERIHSKSFRDYYETACCGFVEVFNEMQFLAK